MTRSWSPEFELAPGQEADRPPEERGLQRDEVRLLVTTPAEDRDYHFLDLPHLLNPGDLLVVNQSATLPARLPARGPAGDFFLHLSTQYGSDLWLAEPRWGPAAPGPIPFAPGDALTVGGLPARWIASYPAIPRLGFVQVRGDVSEVMRTEGRPIRYGYVPRDYPLAAYQTVFSHVPGSAEMPSAGRPFSNRVVRELEARGVRFARIVLHCGVSSLEIDRSAPAAIPVYPEPFHVPEETVDAVVATHARGGRVVAVGTTVVRALESAAEGGCLRPARGFTRLYLSPDRPTRTVDGLLTGFHTASSTHVALLGAFSEPRLLERAYGAAGDRRYLWHEFGDSHLILRDGPGSIAR
ncbi:MAG: S-adenosylmethionine:tRNA ribosyltransferase-isomerase [Thermoplasmata archaeon]|nr:S-adenosylmethionine:tRNA ribosyltransferase-isomerase [Thermoplasmata archaeon]